MKPFLRHSLFSYVCDSMKNLRQPLLLTLAVFAAAPASAVIITEPTRNFTITIPNGDISDVQDPPVTFLQTINDSQIQQLLKIEVGLHLVGISTGSGFASEMFVSLNKDLTFTSVLLNQVGVTTGDPVGQGYDGWDVVFADGAANGDVHAASLVSGILTGNWEPDGRLDPTSTLRPAPLTQLIGGDANGDWRLAVGDLAAGGTMRLVGWSLTLTGETVVPETSTVAAGAAVGLVVGFAWLRRRPKAR